MCGSRPSRSRQTIPPSASRSPTNHGKVLLLCANNQSKVIEPVGLMYVETNCCGWKQSKAKEITKEESPARLIVTREKLYELLVNCIPASVLDTAVFALFFPFAGWRIEDGSFWRGHVMSRRISGMEDFWMLCYTSTRSRASFFVESLQ